MNQRKAIFFGRLRLELPDEGLSLEMVGEAAFVGLDGISNYWSRGTPAGWSSPVVAHCGPTAGIVK